MFDAILPRFNVSVTYIDGTLVENWKDAAKSNTALFYLESPNSWTYELQPLKEIAEFAREKILSLLSTILIARLFIRT